MFALFGLAWLQAAIVPCVMAHATGGPGAAEAPSLSQGMSAHAGHDHAAATVDDHAGGPLPSPCLYCPTSVADHDSCDGHGGCAYPHDPQVDARAATIFAAVPVAIVAPVARVERVADVSEPSTSDAVPRVSLSVSYCRFIE